MKSIKFETGWVIEVKDSVPWYVYLYLQYRVWKMKLSRKFKLDLSKGLFKKYMKNENVVLTSTGLHFPLDLDSFKKNWNTSFFRSKKLLDFVCRENKPY